MAGRKLIWIVTVLSLLIITVLIIVFALNGTENSMNQLWNDRLLMSETVVY
ncbi:hypothetical protein [Oceanobacillus polygoni]|uniref:Uncharacterized protein n=1 Tax=Oceanobacillus polygoni TaxID=1235259 RepID=A0A9X0YR70_9BACI|nr:hypothetical protein [Oceanobacillus polygoni]MBP2077194.1 hypothetical protein [Oceanobacillus polygoni]